MSLRAAHSSARPDIPQIVTRRGHPWSPSFGRFGSEVSIGRVNVLALYDIHGNIDALEAVVRDAPAADVVLVGGDAVPGPFCTAVLDRLAQLPTRWIRGNGEREVAEAIDAPAPAEDDWAAITAKLTANELGPEQSRPLGDLPLTTKIDGVLYCHATPRDDAEILT